MPKRRCDRPSTPLSGSSLHYRSRKAPLAASWAAIALGISACAHEAPAPHAPSELDLGKRPAQAKTTAASVPTFTSGGFCSTPVVSDDGAIALLSDCNAAQGPRLVRLDLATGEAKPVANQRGEFLTPAKGSFLYLDEQPKAFVVHRYELATGKNIAVEIPSPPPDSTHPRKFFTDASAKAFVTVIRTASGSAELAIADLEKGGAPKRVDLDKLGKSAIAPKSSFETFNVTDDPSSRRILIQTTRSVRVQSSRAQSIATSPGPTFLVELDGDHAVRPLLALPPNTMGVSLGGDDLVFGTPAPSTLSATKMSVALHHLDLASGRVRDLRAETTSGVSFLVRDGGVVYLTPRPGKMLMESAALMSLDLASGKTTLVAKTPDESRLSAVMPTGDVRYAIASHLLENATGDRAPTTSLLLRIELGQRAKAERLGTLEHVANGVATSTQDFQLGKREGQYVGIDVTKAIPLRFGPADDLALGDLVAAERHAGHALFRNSDGVFTDVSAGGSERTHISFEHTKMPTACNRGKSGRWICTWLVPTSVPGPTGQPRVTAEVELSR